MRREYKRLAKYCEEVYLWRDVKPGLDIIEKYTSFMENRGPEDADLSLEADFLRAPLIEADILHDVETVSELSTPLLALPCNQLAAHHGSFALWNPEPGHTARRWNLVPNFFLKSVWWLCKEPIVSMTQTSALGLFLAFPQAFQADSRRNNSKFKISFSDLAKSAPYLSTMHWTWRVIFILREEAWQTFLCKRTIWGATWTPSRNASVSAPQCCKHIVHSLQSFVCIAMQKPEKGFKFKF